MTFEETAVLAVAVLGSASVMAWIVLRPFERARREAKRARQHPAE